MGHKSPLYDTQYHEDTNNISSGWDIDIDDLYYTSDHIRGPHIPPETNQYLTDSHPPTAPYHGGYSGYLPNDMSTVETATYPQYSTYGFEEDYMFEAEPFANHFRQGRLEGPHYHQPGSSDPSSLSFHPSELAYAGYEETHSQSSIATSSAITTNYPTYQAQYLEGGGQLSEADEDEPYWVDGSGRVHCLCGCNKSYIREWEWNRAHNSAKFPCKICGRVLARGDALTRHMRNQH
ncbi:hypothetical protein CTheo_30 [Ceratobasidium theobromae]|uniref:C2H2-type domain-containing protein n=1 Tax=Ceratobasidium theobromae TaxID=1582974 RepID=A0A5N5QXT7_9AGAM|nr:hypothetical protein CTheo_30 [Ceratobasidium theobromae]